MEREIFTTLRELLLLLVWEMMQVLRPFHLTPEQFDTLLLLEVDSGWRMGDLSGRLLVDNSKMTRIVDYLEGQGWAERQPDPNDRRAQRVFLTATGSNHREAAQAAHLGALKASLSGFDEAERAQLLDLLAKWRTNLGDS
ncbi:MarR family winged helix-turn-helix transcriptional regulator [Candidatus Leptofilum sp.]|uniref:MarR family winged helix-turn-helix transcriptional regulator n=1 Tax=Candidatus Leptofilum sp. TaxID=3241576 RepID=UPI003B5A6B89